MKGAAGRSGFSVLEALVALAIVALALVPLLALQTDVARNFGRQDQQRDMVSLQHDALALLRDINVATRPSGALTVGEARTIRWTSTPLTRFVRSIGQGASEGGFDVALYRIAVTTELSAGQVAAHFYVDQVGWRRLESVRSEAPPAPATP